jgi:hypothetical protein
VLSNTCLANTTNLIFSSIFIKSFKLLDQTFSMVPVTCVNLKSGNFVIRLEVKIADWARSSSVEIERLAILSLCISLDELPCLVESLFEESRSFLGASKDDCLDEIQHVEK